MYTFYKSLCVINVGSPCGLQGDPIYISYLYDQMWLVGYEGVIVPTALYGAEAWCMRSGERRKVNVLKIKCLISLVGV